MSWSELPRDLLEMIMMQVEHLADYIRSCAVCRWWGSVILSNPLPLRLRFPMLVLSRRTIGMNRCLHALYSLSDHQEYLLELPKPDRPDRCIGSSTNGWICMVDDHLQVSFIQPCSRAVATLPPLRTELVYVRRLVGDGDLEFSIKAREGAHAVPRSGVFSRDAYVKKAIWSAEPTDADCNVIILCHSTYSVLFCCTVATRKWKIVPCDLNFLSDVIYFKNLFYVAGWFGHIYSIDVEDEQHTKIPEMPISNIHERIYLAESPSGLLLIARRIGRTADTITRGFRIFRLHDGATQWLEVCNLDNGMLFLGLNTSFWLSASDFKEGEENSIYFTDDVITEYCIMEQELDPGNDSGVFHLEDQSFSSICDDDMKLLYPHPVWVVPNP